MLSLLFVIPASLIKVAVLLVISLPAPSAGCSGRNKGREIEAQSANVCVRGLGANKLCLTGKERPEMRH